MSFDWTEQDTPDHRIACFRRIWWWKSSMLREGLYWTGSTTWNRITLSELWCPSVWFDLLTNASIVVLSREAKCRHCFVGAPGGSRFSLAPAVLCRRVESWCAIAAASTLLQNTTIAGLCFLFFASTGFMFVFEWLSHRLVVRKHLSSSHGSPAVGSLQCVRFKSWSNIPFAMAVLPPVLGNLKQLLFSFASPTLVPMLCLLPVTFKFVFAFVFVFRSY